jgi:hypothetical protein
MKMVRWTEGYKDTQKRGKMRGVVVDDCFL